MSNSRMVAPFLVAVALCIPVAQAGAQCDFNSGAGSKFRIPLVRAYAGCGYENRAPNTETASGSPACAPVVGVSKCSISDEICDSDADCSPKACVSSSFQCTDDADCGGGLNSCVAVANTCGGDVTDYTFGSKGSCTLSAKSKVEKDCSELEDRFGGSELGMPPGPCHVTYMSAKCKGILQADANPITAVNDSGWQLRTLVRLTLDDGNGDRSCNGGTDDGDDCTSDSLPCTTGGGTCDPVGGGDVTMLDFPLYFQADDPNSGALNLEMNTAQVLYDLIGVAAALPVCTVVEFVEVGLMDPDGLPFARAGLATR